MTAPYSNFQVAGIISPGIKPCLVGVDISVENGHIKTISRNYSHDGPFSNCIAVPGLVQSHIHLCQTVFRGMAENRTLLPWLEEKIWPLEASHDTETLFSSVVISLKELLSSGCTALLDMGSVEHSVVTMEVLRRSGIRAFAGNALMDCGPDYIKKDISWLKEETDRVKKACGDLARYAFTPRFVLSCSEELWRWVVDESESTVRTTHAAESRLESEHSELISDGGHVKYLSSIGFLGQRTLLAHCIWISKEEMDLLGSTGTSVVHCPWANLKLGSGVADIPELISRNVEILIGSDGAACNNQLDLTGDIRLAMGLASIKDSPSRFSGDFWLSSVTTRAAKVLGLNGCGEIREGSCADMVLIEPDEKEREEFLLVEDPVRYLLELNWKERVKATIVNGKILYIDGSFPSIPEPTVSLADVRERLLKRAEKIVPEGTYNSV